MIDLNRVEEIKSNWLPNKTNRQIRSRRYYLSQVDSLALLHFEIAVALMKYENKE